MSRTKVFISYSHKDDRWKNRLVSHLGVLAREGLLETWDDQKLVAGEDFVSRLNQEMLQSRIAVLLISADFLTSDFIRMSELPQLFDQHARVGMTLFPLLIRDCAWQEVQWPARMTLRPRDAKPVASRRSMVDQIMAEVAREIAAITRGTSTSPLDAKGLPHESPTTSRASSTATVPDEPDGSISAGGRTSVPAPAEANQQLLAVLFIGEERGTGLDLRGQLAKTKKAIARAKFWTSVKISSVFNVTPDELLMKLNRSAPAVLHLSGVQEDGKIKMYNDRGLLAPVESDHLAGLFAQFSQILRMVILDTCESLRQAKDIVKGVDSAIGVAGPIAEPVAIDFFAMFYNAIASGASVERAYSTARGLELSKIEGDPKYRREIEEILEARFDPEQHLPQVVTRQGIDLANLFLVKQ